MFRFDSVMLTRYLAEDRTCDHVDVALDDCGLPAVLQLELAMVEELLAEGEDRWETTSFLCREHSSSAMANVVYANLGPWSSCR